MRLRSKETGPGRAPLIIAEIGVNHDRDLPQALEMVDVAARAGADAIKTQHFRADLLLSAQATLAEYQRSAGERDPREMLRRLEIEPRHHEVIAQHARSCGLAWVVTVFSMELIEAMEAIGPDAYKVASPDIVHRPLIESLQATGRPLIVSTGAATMEEVCRAERWLADARREDRLALLHCVSAYPTPEDQAALGGLLALWREFGDPVGYSDHTGSTTLGAEVARHRGSILEKHLTLDRSAVGPDHSSSLNPVQFEEYCSIAKGTLVSDDDDSLRRLAAGATKVVLSIELDVRQRSRQSIVTSRAVEPGATITRADLSFKRPGTGLEPWRLEEVIGRAATASIDADVPLHEGDFA